MSNSARPTGSADDLRAASNLTTTLSGYLITAALAVLGGQAIVVTFVIDKRNQLEAFYAVSAVGTASLVCSIILGGAGIYEIVHAGARGEWKVSTKGGKFNLQAVLALLGAVLVVASAFLGHSKPPA